MKRKQFSEEQIIGILKEAEAGAVVTDLCRRHGMSSATYYAWKAKFGGLEVSDAKRLRALEEENTRLKRLLADTMLDNAGLKDLLSKKVTPAEKREAVAHLQTALGMSARRTCAVVGADRKSMRYRSCRADDGDLRSRLRELAQQRRRFGYRRLHILLRRDGITINRKKTQRLYREKGLTVRRRKGRRRAVGARAPAPVLALPNQRWSLDFVHDQLVTGRRFRVLNIVDDVTRECLRAVVDTSISGRRVVRELADLIAEGGRPEMIVSDNGTSSPQTRCLPGLATPASSGIISRPASRRRTGTSRASTVACATSCSTRRCSSPSARQAQSSRAGSTTTTPSDRTRHLATPHRQRSPPGSNSNGRG